MNSIDAVDCQTVIAAMAVTIRENRDVLSALDAVLGDGDHGFNMDAAMQAAVVELDSAEIATPADVFKTTGNTLINEVGGASGIIFGSFFTGGARAVKAKEVLNLTDIVAFFEQGIAKVQKRGKASVGDKTLLDSLVPALTMLAALDEAAAELPEAMQSAADAAMAGAKATKAYAAQHGRAKFLGDRSIGHQDAGATSMAMMLQAWADCLKGESDE